jgi:hypothetical protein
VDRAKRIIEDGFETGQNNAFGPGLYTFSDPVTGLASAYAAANWRQIEDNDGEWDSPVAVLPIYVRKSVIDNNEVALGHFADDPATLAAKSSPPNWAVAGNINAMAAPVTKLNPWLLAQSGKWKIGVPLVFPGRPPYDTKPLPKPKKGLPK